MRPESSSSSERLERARPHLDRAIKAVGRIELKGSWMEWVGTGWLVADDILVTNRHVEEATERIAQKYGARGVLIYSDPADDGYFRGDVYPKGPYRPDSAVQRGSIQFLPIYPGDPTTPGVAKGEAASRHGVRSVG